VAGVDIDISELTQDLNRHQLESSCESKFFITQRQGEVVSNGNFETYVVYGTDQNARRFMTV